MIFKVSPVLPCILLDGSSTSTFLSLVLLIWVFSFLWLVYLKISNFVYYFKKPTLWSSLCIDLSLHFINLFLSCQYFSLLLISSLDFSCFFSKTLSTLFIWIFWFLFLFSWKHFNNCLYSIFWLHFHYPNTSQILTTSLYISLFLKTNKPKSKQTKEK